MMIISGWVGWPTSWCAMVKGSTWNVWGSRLNGSFGGKSTSDIIFVWYCRVWGGEETINEYKARIRIFSVRHQDTLGVQERFERQESKIPKKFHLVGSGLGAGRLFHSVWAGSVVFGSLVFKCIFDFWHHWNRFILDLATVDFISMDAFI